MGKVSSSSQKRTKLHSTRLRRFGVYQRTVLNETQGREFEVDSEASMHVLSRKDLNSADLEPIRVSSNPTTIITATGEVQTNEEATMYFHDLELFVTKQILEDTSAVLPLGKLCEDHGYSFEWTSGQKSHLIKNDKIIPIVVPGLSTGSSFSTASTSSTSLAQDSTEDSTSSPATSCEILQKIKQK